METRLVGACIRDGDEWCSPLRGSMDGVRYVEYIREGMKEIGECVRCVRGVESWRVELRIRF